MKMLNVVTDENGNVTWTFAMPRFFALTNQGEVVLGCAECGYRSFALHECTSECSPHEIVRAPIPLNVPHRTHA